MQKRNTVRQSLRALINASEGPITVGIDLGDKTSRYCVLNSSGEVVQEAGFATTKAGVAEAFEGAGRCRVAMEVGTHSPWMSRLVASLGHEVIVANARELQAISNSSRKDDRRDAETLARLARVDPKLLRPVRHRGEKAQADLLKVRARAALVEARTSLINSARGLAKASGERLATCDADTLSVARLAMLPSEVREALKPVIEQVESLTEKIKKYDEELEQIARTEYPETRLLKQVSGVGTLIALTFVLTVDDPGRFDKSRDVGCYAGLRPRRGDSGERQPELRITKEGDVYLRKLLVQAGQYILGQRGPDTDLRRWGLKLAGGGGKNAKKRAVVAVARKLAVLLHRLWVTGEVYEPLRNARAAERASRRAA